MPPIAESRALEKIALSSALFLGGVVVLAAAFLVPPSMNHPVTPAMLAKASEATGRRVPAGRVQGTGGFSDSLASLAGRRPLVLIFIQDGCPCSEAAEPYFHRLHAAYGDRVTILGVVDGDRSVADDWSKRRRAPYPILADPDHLIIDACGAERSANVALVTRAGTIETLWPGYSADMLTDLGRRLARLTGVDPIPFDTTDAPIKLAAGCRF